MLPDRIRVESAFDPAEPAHGSSQPVYSELVIQASNFPLWE